MLLNNFTPWFRFICSTSVKRSGRVLNYGTAYAISRAIAGRSSPPLSQCFAPDVQIPCPRRRFTRRKILLSKTKPFYAADSADNSQPLNAQSRKKNIDIKFLGELNGKSPDNHIHHVFVVDHQWIPDREHTEFSRSQFRGPLRRRRRQDSIVVELFTDSDRKITDSRGHCCNIFTSESVHLLAPTPDQLRGMLRVRRQ